MAEPEEYAQYISDQQGQADEGAEALRVPRAINHLILRYIGHHAAEYHEPARNKAHQLSEAEWIGRRLADNTVKYVIFFGCHVQC